MTDDHEPHGFDEVEAELWGEPGNRWARCGTVLSQAHDGDACFAAAIEATENELRRNGRSYQARFSTPIPAA